MEFIKTIPCRVVLIIVCGVLLGLYYIRPDPLTIDLVKGFMGALLLSLNPGDHKPKEE